MLRRRFFLPSITAAALLLAATTGGVLSGGFGATAVAATNGTLAATAGCGKAPTLASGTRTIQSSGQSRTFILRIPDGYDRNHPYRLIFGFHWLNGSANDVTSAGYYGAWPTTAAAVEQQHDLRRPAGSQRRLGEHQRSGPDPLRRHLPGRSRMTSAWTPPSVSPWAGATAGR